MTRRIYTPEEVEILVLKEKKKASNKIADKLGVIMYNLPEGEEGVVPKPKPKKKEKKVRVDTVVYSESYQIVPLSKFKERSVYKLKKREVEK